MWSVRRRCAPTIVFRLTGQFCLISVRSSCRAASNLLYLLAGIYRRHCNGCTRSSPAIESRKTSCKKSPPLGFRHSQSRNPFHALEKSDRPAQGNENGKVEE